MASNSFCVLTANLKGGIGNQLFQIAATVAMARRVGAEPVFFHREHHECRQGRRPGCYADSVLQNVPFLPSQAFSQHGGWATVNERRWSFEDMAPRVVEALARGETHIILDGYFQSASHFVFMADEIRRLFTPRGGAVAWLRERTDVFRRHPELAIQNGYCFLGVRRGDYITHADFHKPCGMSYYASAMARVQAERYYVVSDDMVWCRRNFIGPQFAFLDFDDDEVAFMASRLFSTYIISNSSFYWWSSFLSEYPSPRVVAPNQWIAGEHGSIYRDGMEVLARPVETT